MRRECFVASIPGAWERGFLFLGLQDEEKIPDAIQDDQ